MYIQFFNEDLIRINVQYKLGSNVNENFNMKDESFTESFYYIDFHDFDKFFRRGTHVGIFDVSFGSERIKVNGMYRSREIFLREVMTFEDFINSITEKDWLDAVQKNPGVYKFIPNPTEDMTISAVIGNPYLIRDFPEIQSPKICFIAIALNGTVFEYVIEKTYEMSLVACRSNGCVIRNIENPKLELRIAAVIQNGNALQYIKEQTPKICQIAVRQTPYSKKYALELAMLKK